MDVTTTNTRRLTITAILAVGMAGCAINAPQYPTRLDALMGPAALVNAKNLPIQTAAKIKLDKKMKAQKIKALKYLAKVGCGCKGKEFKVAEALLAGLADCDEDVRRAALDAICKTITESECEVCNGIGCCDLALSAKLYEMAYKTDAAGCPLEPSEELRIAAANVYCLCPLYKPGMVVPQRTDDQRIETPQDPPPMPEAPAPVDRASADSEDLSATTVQEPENVASTTEAPATIGRAHVSSSDYVPAVVAQVPVVAQAPVVEYPAVAETYPSVDQGYVAPTRGVVKYVDAVYGTARVEFEGRAYLPRGSRLVVYHRYTMANVSSAGQLEVISSSPGTATVRPLGMTRIGNLATGDSVSILGG